MADPIRNAREEIRRLHYGLGYETIVRLEAELAEKTRELETMSLDLSTVMCLHQVAERELTEARAENERLRAVVERVRNAMAIGADPEQFEQLYQAWLAYEAQQRPKLTNPPAPASPVECGMIDYRRKGSIRCGAQARYVYDPDRADDGTRPLYACQACYDQLASDNFKRVCRELSSPAESRDDGESCSCRLLFGERIWGDCDDGRCKGSAYVGGVP